MFIIHNNILEENPAGLRNVRFILWRPAIIGHLRICLPSWSNKMFKDVNLRSNFQYSDSL